MTKQEKKEFNDLLKTQIQEHLSKNNNSIKIRLTKTDSIVIEDIIFDISPITFIDNKCSYTLFNKGKKQIEIKNIKEIIFKNCEFQYEPVITSQDIWSIKFVDCNFRSIQDISSNILKITNQNKKVYFENCEFEELKFGDIRHIKYNSNIKLSYFEFIECEIDEFIIENIEIASKFYINKQSKNYNKTSKIKKLTIENAIFKENFKIHNCEIDEISIQDSDFEKQFDFYSCHFNGNNIFDALNIKGLSIFDKTQFNNFVDFNYVSFQNNVNFRNAVFKDGLNLEKINIWNDSTINFYGIQGLESIESMKSTSQETYRLIKYYFSQIGNTIESNKYHALELELYTKNNLKNIKDNFLLDKNEPSSILSGIVTIFHKVSSNHSSNWFYTVLWIFLVSLLTNIYLDSDLTSIEYYFKYINILSTLEDFNGSYIIMTLNKVSLGYLYYQFLTSVRKDTKK